METRVCRLHGVRDIRIETLRVAAPGAGEALVAVGAAGICGSDLHYFLDGGFGPIRVREPMILGHEAAGTVVAVGAGVAGLARGDLVAINPSRPCGACRFCAEGLFQHCLGMRFSGSAMRFPHEQGLYRDRIVVPAAQCVPVPPGTTVAEAACAEPLAVCLHAGAQAGPLAGRRVLVTGAGPIGAFCTAVAAEAGAAEIVTTDVEDFPLATAARMGATRTINVARDREAMAVFAADKGHFDVAFECSGAPAAIRSAIEVLHPRATLVQVGIAGDVTVPLNLVVGKEIVLRGTHRFHPEFAEAVALIGARRIDVRPVVTASFPMAEAAEAFAVAADRKRAVKVHLAFAGAG